MNQEQNTTEQIKSRFKELPPGLQKAITASDLPQKIRSISQKYSLLLDMADALGREVLITMLGLEKASDFTKNISKELNIDRETANLITTDVNNLIFEEIKTHLRELEAAAEDTDEDEKKIEKLEDMATTQPQPSPEPIPQFNLPMTASLQRDTPSSVVGAQNAPISRESLKKDMEAVGGITIHDEVPTSHPDIPTELPHSIYSSTPTETPTPTQSLPETDPTLTQNPQVPHKSVAAPSNLPGQTPVVGMTDIHTDALVDHLLGKVANAIQEQISQKKPMPKPVPRPTDGGDPYREPIL